MLFCETESVFPSTLPKFAAKVYGNPKDRNQESEHGKRQGKLRVVERKKGSCYGCAQYQKVIRPLPEERDFKVARIPCDAVCLKVD